MVHGPQSSWAPSLSFNTIWSTYLSGDGSILASEVPFRLSAQGHTSCRSVHRLPLIVKIFVHVHLCNHPFLMLVPQSGFPLGPTETKQPWRKNPQWFGQTLLKHALRSYVDSLQAAGALKPVNQRFGLISPFWLSGFSCLLCSSSSLSGLTVVLRKHATVQHATGDPSWLTLCRIQKSWKSCCIDMGHWLGILLTRFCVKYTAVYH